MAHRKAPGHGSVAAGVAIVLPENSDPVRARLDIPWFVLGAVALGSATFATIAGETAGYIAGSTILAFTTYFGIFSLFFFVALYLEVVGATSPFHLALDFIPMTVGMVLASVLTGRRVSRSGPRVPMTVGCLLAAAGIFLTDALITAHAGLGSVGWTGAHLLRVALRGRPRRRPVRPGPAVPPRADGPARTPPRPGRPDGSPRPRA